MSNALSFLDAFNTIERHLRDLTDEPRTTGFYALVDAAARKQPLVRRYADDLKEFADLRNAIVHERSDGRVIAEPNDRALSEIQRLAAQLLRPPRVLPEFQREVLALDPGVPLAKALKLMYERDFSQLPIYAGAQFVGLLTNNTIGRWLGANVATDLFSVNETTIEQVLGYREADDAVAFVDRETTLVEVEQTFVTYEQRGKSLDALLITQNGRETEKPLGIITVYDLPTIDRLVGM